MTGRGGFTLLESMFVLFIVTTVLLVSQAVTIRHSTTMIDERTVAQFKYDVLLTQLLAMHEGSHAQLKLENAQTYKITTHLREIKRTIPQHVELQHSANLGRTITFTAVGTTNASGTIYYDGVQRDYRLVIQLGRGRIRVEDA